MPVLPIILPLIVAAFMAGGDSMLPRRAVDVISTATALTVFVLACILTSQTVSEPIIYWLGGWRPDAPSHFPLGICLVIDPLAAGTAAFVSLLVLSACVFSWFYFKSVQSYFHAIIMVFMGAMNGLCMTGDLFNLFVFFELMTAAGVTLCGYKSQNEGPLQGAVNFAVVNTIGAFLSLIGVALIYSYTGTLNMAVAGQTFATHPPGGFLVPICLMLVLCGFLVKAAAVPFHFWLADAHAVAPTPVSVLFSGIMVELGVYAAFRLYYGTFSEALGPHDHGVRLMFLLIGALSATIGAILCITQRHLKRLLAFSTVSHTGLLFLGLAMLTPTGIAGVAIYLLGHGLIKSALFFCTGIFLHHFHSVDEFELRDCGRSLYPTIAIMLMGALGLAGVPPFATAFGASMINHEAASIGAGWISVFFILSGVLTAAAVLRVSARIFWGYGEPKSPITRGAPRIDESSETKDPEGPTPYTMWIPAAVLIVAAMALAVRSPLRECVVQLTERATETHLFRDAVLLAAPAPLDRTPVNPESIGLEVLEPILTILLAVGVCMLSLYPSWLPQSIRRGIGWVADPILKGLRGIHSGRVGDYVALLALGVAIYGFVLLL